MKGVPPDTPRASSTPSASPGTRILWFVGAPVLFAVGVMFAGGPSLRAQPSPNLRSGPSTQGPIGSRTAAGPRPGDPVRDGLPETGPVPAENGLVDTPRDATEPLVDVRIEGNTTIPASAIAKYIKTRPGRPATQKQIREDVRALYGTRWFFTIEPRLSESTDGPVLVFRVVERPIVKSVEFRGASKKRRKWLEAETGLKVGSPFDPSANRESVRRIERYYREKGHYHVKVDLVKGGDPGDREVVFEIVEGPKVRVTGTNFVGNEFVSDAVLRLHLQTKVAWVWVIGGLYDPETIPNDVDALKRYYFGLGFFDAQIGYREIVSEDKASVTIEYKIAEGTRYKVNAVEFEGNRIFTNEEFLEHLDLEAGDYFNERHLNKDIAHVRSRYGELGRIFATVEAIPRYLDKTGEVDLVYRIDEDRPYRIRRIDVNIAGDHSHTQRHVALNYLPFAPGDLADPNKIDFAKRRLAGIRVFDSAPGMAPEVNIVPVPETELYAVNDVFRGQQNDAVVASVIPAGHTLAGHTAHRPDNRGADFPSARATSAVDRLGRPAVFRPDEHTSPFESLDANVARSLDANPLDAATNLDTNRLDASLEALRRDAANAPRSGRTFELRENRDRLVPTSQYVPLDVESVFRGQSPEADFGPGDVVLAQARGLGQFDPPDYRYDNDPSGAAFGDAEFAPPGSVPIVDPGLVDLDFTLNEAQTGRLMFGVGVNSDAGVVGTISLQEDNFNLFNPPRRWSDWGNGAFRGGGQRLRIEAVPGNIVSRYLVSWTDPFIFGSNYSLSLSGFYFNRFYRDWDEERTGGRISIGRVLGPVWSVTGTYRVEQINLTNPSTLASPTLNMSLGDRLLQTAGAALARDTRDSPFLPTEGSHQELRAEQAFGDFDFTRLSGESRHYFTTYQRADGRGRHVLSAGGDVGWTSDETPIYERFYAGGFQTFRGFDFRGVSPIEGGVRIGGEWSALGSVEYKVPVTADENLAVVAFTDFGTIDNAVGLNNFRLAVGTGLRITVPAMGPVPLAFDFAVPLVQQDFDDERVFSFYIGIQR